MKLDTVIELISIMFFQTFDGAEKIVCRPPTENSQVILVTDHENNTYRIEVSKV